MRTNTNILCFASPRMPPSSVNKSVLTGQIPWAAASSPLLILVPTFTGTRWYQQLSSMGFRHAANLYSAWARELLWQSCAATHTHTSSQKLPKCQQSNAPFYGQHLCSAPTFFGMIVGCVGENP